MKIRGDKRHRRRLKKMRSREIVRELGKYVYAGADSVRAEAQALIAEGSIQGEGHVPSKPYEPPNLDTGVLSAGITARRTGPLKAIAESAAPYAVHLEVGTSKMIERPYMAPAAKTVRGEYTIKIRAGLSRFIRKG